MGCMAQGVCELGFGKQYCVMYPQLERFGSAEAVCVVSDAWFLLCVEHGAGCQQFERASKVTSQGLNAMASRAVHEGVLLEKQA